MVRRSTTKDRKKQGVGTCVSASKKRFSLSLRDSTIKRRRCLMCGKNFLSSGPHNRRCKRCNQKVSQAGENAFYVPRTYSANYRFGESSNEQD